MRILRSIFLAVILVLTGFAAVAESTDAEQANRHIYLIYGVDGNMGLSREARSDAMLICQVDHTNQKVSVVSIARDSLVKNEKGGLVKINTLCSRESNAQKASQTLVGVIKRNFGVEPEGWFRLNFNSVVQLVDAVGGVTVDLSAEEARYINRYSGVTSKKKILKVQKGPALLNGAQALAFVRCRHLDDDLGRGGRQRRFVSAFMKAIQNLSLIQLMSLFNAMNGAWLSSYSTPEQLFLIKELLPARSYTFESISIPFKGTYRLGNAGDVSGVVMDLNQNRKMLLEALGRN